MLIADRARPRLCQSGHCMRCCCRAITFEACFFFVYSNRTGPNDYCHRHIRRRSRSRRRRLFAHRGSKPGIGEISPGPGIAVSFKSLLEPSRRRVASHLRRRQRPGTGDLVEALVRSSVIAPDVGIMAVVIQDIDGITELIIVEIKHADVVHPDSVPDEDFGPPSGVRP